MSHKINRRELALVFSASAALVAQPPAAAPLPQNADEELQAVRTANRQNSEQLAKVELPMSTEPATHFSA